LRQRVSSGSPLEPEIGFSRAARVRDVRPATGFILVAGFIDPRRRVEIEADAIVS
jgi:hypothetical protein